MSLEGIYIGRYHLLQLIGSGGMGEVYLAEDERIEQQVAFKVVRSDLASYPHSLDASRLFKREARTVARLDHPNILPLFDFGEETVNGISLAYLIMPYRSASSFDRWLRARHEQPSLQDIAHFIYQAADALQHAHDLNIVHRDVKPSNFLLRINKERPNQPDLLLADFGIAMFFNATASMSQNTHGTPTFMPPEQWASTAVPATDQYALAIMTYALLVGRPPFEGRPEQVMYQHFNVQPQPPSTLNQLLPSSLDDVILRALAKQPEDRFETILAFARAFQAASKPPASSPSTSHEDLHTTSIPEQTDSTPSSQEMAAETVLPVQSDPDQHITPAFNTFPGDDEPTLIPLRPPAQQPANLPSAPDPDEHAISSVLVKHQDLILDQQSPYPNLQSNEHTTLPASHPALDNPTTPASDPSLDDHIIPPVSQPNSGEDTIPPAPHPIPEGFTAPLAPYSRKLRFSDLPRDRVLALLGLVMLLILIGIDIFSVARIPSLVTNGVNATATSYVKSLSRAYAAQAAATMAITSNPYVANSGPFVLYDPLTANHNKLWEEDNYSDGYCRFMAGAYHAATTKKNTVTSCIDNTSYINFVFEVQMTMLKGDYGGIIFRSNRAENSYYDFIMSENGSYKIEYYAVISNSAPNNSTGTFLTIVSGNARSIIHSGTNLVNVVAVVAQGSNFDLFINKQHIATVTEGLYRASYVGIAVGDNTNSTEAIFHNARIWQL